MTDQQIWSFVRESNAIERIFREPFQTEIDELKRFIQVNTVSIEELKKFLKVYQPDARLRSEYGLDVRVGSYYPPFGGPEIRDALITLLAKHNSLTPLEMHIAYERLHPFTDGNGRSGRALWLWKIISLGNHPYDSSFLATFYIYSFRSDNIQAAKRLEELKHEHTTQSYPQMLIDHYFKTLKDSPKLN